jgi:hypothetical protein
MNSIELFFLNLGLSWTLAKLIPYVIALLIGLLFSYISWKKMAKMHGALRYSIAVLLLAGPFGGYFAYSPIYQGDFSNDVKVTALTNELSELKGKELIVLALPGCPFCAQSMAKSAKLIERNPQLKVTYIITRADKDALKWYTEKAKNGIVVQPATNDEAISHLARGKFPTFAVVNGNSVRTWSNDGFGVVAIDEIEKLF